ncbi:hypothetical protein GCM10018952_29700 [Streptosporangium vulgare]
MVVTLVRVATGGVGLPDLHELAAHRAAVPVEDAAVHGDALAQRFGEVLPGQVGVERGDVGDAEDRPGQFGRVRVLERDQRLPRVAEHGAAVGAVVAGRVVRLPAVTCAPGPGPDLALAELAELGDLAVDVGLREGC